MTICVTLHDEFVQRDFRVGKLLCMSPRRCFLRILYVLGGGYDNFSRGEDLTTSPGGWPGRSQLGGSSNLFMWKE